jgi:hypothetical protein
MEARLLKGILTNADVWFSLQKSADSFKRMLEFKAKEYTLEYLLKLKGKQSKIFIHIH